MQETLIKTLWLGVRADAQTLTANGSGGHTQPSPARDLDGACQHNMTIHTRFTISTVIILIITARSRYGFMGAYRNSPWRRC